LERKEFLSPGETEANSIVNIPLGSDDVKKVELDRIASDSEKYFATSSAPVHDLLKMLQTALQSRILVKIEVTERPLGCAFEVDDSGGRLLVVSLKADGGGSQAGLLLGDEIVLVSESSAASTAMGEGPERMLTFIKSAKGTIGLTVLRSKPEDKSKSDHQPENDNSNVPKFFDTDATMLSVAGCLAITKYAWSDGKTKVSVYVELDGLDDVPDSALALQHNANSIMLDIAYGSGVKWKLSLSPLAYEVSDVKLTRKIGKNTVVLKLEKKEQQGWSQLLAS